MKIEIPVYQPSLKGNVTKYVNDCIRSSWISSRGKYINKFENYFAAYTGVAHAMTVSNGTVALHLALLALDIKKGDEVIVPTFTYIATVNPVRFVGATPVFVDARYDTWQIDHEKIREKITRRTKAIIVAHLYGHPCEMDKIVSICREHSLYLIEDCAEATGSTYRRKHVGTFGDISVFSFYGNKTVTTGEGGMVTTNNKELHDTMYTLKMQGISSHRQYWHETIGYNYKMTNICAAIGLAQMEQIDAILKKKTQLAQWYAEEFEKYGIEFHRSQKHVFNSYWMFSMLTNSHSQREKLRDHLIYKHGIETRPTFYPVHTMPMYLSKKNKLPVSEDIGLRGINLPSFPELSRKKIQSIARIIYDFMKKNH